MDLINSLIDNYNLPILTAFLLGILTSISPCPLATNITAVAFISKDIKNPTYENHEGHAEAVEIDYDTEITSYKNLLDFFFRVHNPTTLNSQGNDRGAAYRSAIFYNNDDEKKEAAEFIERVNKSGRWKDPVVTSLEPFEQFYPAEDYHQDYLQKNPEGYTCHYSRFGSYL